MATTDSFSLHDFIDCFNRYIGHAAQLQPNEICKQTFQLFIKIVAIVSKIPVSHIET